MIIALIEQTEAFHKYSNFFRVNNRKPTSYLWLTALVMFPSFKEQTFFITVTPWPISWPDPCVPTWWWWCWVSLLFCNLTLLPMSVKSLEVLLFSSGTFFSKCITLSDVQHLWQCWIFEPLTLRARWGPALSWIYYSLLWLIPFTLLRGYPVVGDFWHTDSGCEPCWLLIMNLQWMSELLAGKSCFGAGRRYSNRCLSYFE